MLSLRKWWRKRQKERKRLKLLALVRKVREEQGDYDRVVSSTTKTNAPAKKVDSRKRLHRAGKGRKTSQRQPVL